MYYFIYLQFQKNFFNFFMFFIFFRIRENEISLLKKVKEFIVIFEKQRSELEKGDNFFVGFNVNEVIKFRE